MKLSIVQSIQKFSIKKPLLVFSFVMLFSLLFFYFVLQVEIDSDLQSFLPEEERSYSLLRNTTESQPEKLLVISSEIVGDYSVSGLQALYEAYRQLENIDGIKTGITPFNLFRFTYERKRIGVSTMSRGGTAPSNPEELNDFLYNLKTSNLAQDFIISSSGDILFAYFPLGPDLDNDVALQKINSIISDLEGTYLVHITGSIPIDQRFSYLLKKNFSILLTLSVIIILLVFYLGFRSFRSVLYAFSVVSLGTIWCIGFMGMLKFKLTLMSVVLPPIVLTLGSSYAIHIINHFYRFSFHKREIKEITFFQINKTVILASSTTVIGFLGLLTVGNTITMQFALAAAFGIFSCAVLALFFLPPLLVFFRGGTKKKKRAKKDFFLRFVYCIQKFVFHRSKIIILVMVSIPFIFFLSLHLITFNTDQMNYFPKNDPVIEDMYYFTHAIGGFDYIYITLRAPAGEAGYFLKKDILDTLFMMEKEIKNHIDVCDIISLTTLLTEMNYSINGLYEIPDSKGAILLLSRYISLYVQENENFFLNTISNKDFSEVTFSVRVFNGNTNSFIDEGELRNFIRDINEIVGKILPETITYSINGKGMKYLSLSNLFKENLWFSIITSTVSVAIIVFLTFLSFKITLLSLIPLIMGILINFILMALTDIPLDMTTTMVFSIAIGVGIDDAIHFLIQYTRKKKVLQNDIPGVLRRTMLTTGKPILLTSTAIILGFLVLIFASFKPITFFGILIVFIIFAATVGTLFFIPTLLITFSNKKSKHAKIPIR